jgi:hypothetical protein
VVQDVALDVAHCIDIEVVEQCGDALLENARYVVMPWVPHVRGTRGLLNRTYFGPEGKTLEDYCETYAVLRQLNDAQRLLWYNLESAPDALRRPDGPVIGAEGFSASAVVNLLASCGVKEIRTLGVDGGTTYSDSFRSLRETTLLPTRQQSFDIQFQAIAKTIFRDHINLQPLNLETPICVYVGTQREQELATLVLEYSIRKHTSMAVKVEPLYLAVEQAGIELPIPKDKSMRPRTPFSFQRFAIPMLKNFQGRAIYVDSDMQVFKDLRALWSLPFGDADLLSVDEISGSNRRPQFSVMLLDCEALKWDPADLVNGLDNGRWNYEEPMYDMVAARRVSASIPARWNDLERYDPERTALTHYTEMNTQPWLSTQNRLGKIWCEALFEAIACKFIKPELVANHVENGWVRPSLLYQIEHRIIDPLLLPSAIIHKDATGFVPPHRTLAITHRLTGYGGPPEPLQLLARKCYARARWLIEASRIRPLLKRVIRKMLG